MEEHLEHLTRIFSEVCESISSKLSDHDVKEMANKLTFTLEEQSRQLCEIQERLQRLENGLEEIAPLVERANNSLTTLEKRIVALELESKEKKKKEEEKSQCTYQSLDTPKQKKIETKESHSQNNGVYLKLHRDNILKECEKDSAAFLLQPNPQDSSQGAFELCATIDNICKNKGSIFSNENSRLENWTSSSTSYIVTETGLAVKSQAKEWMVIRPITVLFNK